MYAPKTSFKRLRHRQFFNYYLFQIPKVGIYFSSKIKYRHNIAGNPCWLTEMIPNHQMLFRWALVKEPRYIPSPSCYLFQVFAKELRYIPGFTRNQNPWARLLPTQHKFSKTQTWVVV
jgi:hypothetical protein